jgi:AcrR family transcriptional regulator
MGHATNGQRAGEVPDESPNDVASSKSARSKLLAAAARVFEARGSTGATTRQIAEEAGVNEVTLFRHFGSKDALLDAAIHLHVAREQPTPLPEVPVDPESEVAVWCARELARLNRSSDILRRCFAETGERTVHVREAGGVIARSAGVLRAYTERLEAAGIVSCNECDAAVAMLVSTIASDALVRDDVPEVYRIPLDEAPLRYARAFLRTLAG